MTQQEPDSSDLLPISWIFMQYISCTVLCCTTRKLPVFTSGVRMYKIIVQSHVQSADDPTCPTLHLTDLFNGEEPSHADGEDISPVYGEKIPQVVIYVLSRCKPGVTGEIEQVNNPQVKRIDAYLSWYCKPRIRFRTYEPDFSDLLVPMYDWFDPRYGPTNGDIPKDLSAVPLSTLAAHNCVVC
jgi:hypothetical protein